MPTTNDGTIVNIMQARRPRIDDTNVPVEERPDPEDTSDETLILMPEQVRERLEEHRSRLARFPYLEVLGRGSAGRRRFLMRLPIITLGRAMDNHIVLDDPLVSKHHAIVREIQRAFYVIDQQSRNGTFVNNVKIEEHRLRPNDTLGLGDTRLRFFIPE